MNMKTLARCSLTMVAAALLCVACERKPSEVVTDEENSNVVEQTGGQATGNKEGSPEGDESGADMPGMYERLGEMYEQMTRHHQRMDMPMVQGTASMQQMHRQMMHMGRHHQMMMGEQHGMMGDQHGMMGEQPGRMHDDDRQRMGRGDMTDPQTMAVWHQQMAEQQTQRAEEIEKAGNQEVAERHREIAEMHRQMAKMMLEDQPELDRAQPADDSEASGADTYARTCASCHGSDGKGAPQAFPPLDGSSIVTGDIQPLVRIVHGGLTGEIEVDGRTYSGVMPGFGDRLSTTELAGVLTYIRSAWGNQAAEITPEQVRGAAEPGRQRPWTPRELGIAQTP